MNGSSCHVRNLRADSLSGFRKEKDALAAGGSYLRPGADGWLDAGGCTGLCVVCENCGSVIEEVSGTGELSCPDCGELTFRVFQTFRLVPIKDGFSARWHVPGLMVAIDVPDSAVIGMTGIHYTTDGSDPILTSPVYTKEIAYRKEYAPIRAAVYYPDARSQIIEWDYGRAEKNRKRIRKQSVPPRIKKLSPPTSAAPESHPAESKDGGRGWAVFHGFAMLIGGIVLVCNDRPVVGCILIIVAILTFVGICQDAE